MTRTDDEPPLTPRIELTRKLLHIGFGFAALSLHWLTRGQALAIALAATFFNLCLLPAMGGRTMYRAHEQVLGFSPGMVSYPLIVLALLLLLPLPSAGAIWAIMAFGDGFAALGGRGLGGPRLPWNRAKSWTGLVSFAVAGAASSAAIYTFCGGSGGLAACAVTACVCAGVESLPLRLTDNVSIAVVGAPLLQCLLTVSPAKLLAQPLELWLLAVLMNAALVAAAWKLGTLDGPGAATAALVGVTVQISMGFQGLVVLLAFFAIGSSATRLGFTAKLRLGIAQEHRGARSIRNVLANGAVPAFMAFMAACGHASPLFRAAFVGAVAAATFDTASSEIGEWWGGKTYRVISFQPCEVGENGGVSIEGTVAGFAAAALVAALAVALGVVGRPTAAIAVLAGAAGGTVDSILGDTLERGDWLDNDAVNFLCTVAGALTAYFLEGFPNFR